MSDYKYKLVETSLFKKTRKLLKRQAEHKKSSPKAAFLINL